MLDLNAEGHQSAHKALEKHGWKEMPFTNTAQGRHFTHDKLKGHTVTISRDNFFHNFKDKMLSSKLGEGKVNDLHKHLGELHGTQHAEELVAKGPLGSIKRGTV